MDVYTPQGMSLACSTAGAPVWRMLWSYDPNRPDVYGYVPTLTLLPDIDEPLSWPSPPVGPPGGGEWATVYNCYWRYPAAAICPHGDRILLAYNTFWAQKEGEPPTGWSGLYWRRNAGAGWTAPKAVIRANGSAPAGVDYCAAIIMAPTEDLLLLGPLSTRVLIWNGTDYIWDEGRTCSLPGTMSAPERGSLAQAGSGFCAVYRDDLGLKLAESNARGDNWGPPQDLGFDGHTPALACLAPTTNLLLLYHDGNTSWYSRVLTRAAAGWTVGAPLLVTDSSTYNPTGGGALLQHPADGSFEFHYWGPGGSATVAAPILVKHATPAGDGWY